MFIVISYLLLALFGNQLAPYSFTDQHLSDALQPPSSAYWLGTDQFGRDILSRIIIGSRSILLLATASTGLALLLGVSIGLIAGYFGGLWDEILMRGADILLSFPALLLALLVISSLGSAMIYLILTVGVIFSPAIARIVRSAVLDVKTKEFLEAARAIGVPTLRILRVHVLGNIMDVVVVEAAIYFGYAILVGAGLGFLGLGAQPPSPDWGLQVNDGRNFLLAAPWIAVFPALAISSLVISVNLLADGLTDSIQGHRHV